MPSTLAGRPNPWEEQALLHTTAHPKPAHTFDSIIYPGIYSHSGLDVLTVLASIHARPNPSIPLGAVDASCAIAICDLLQPDQPIIYTSEGFTLLTGYRGQEVLGRNLRFLQAPPPRSRSRSPLPFASGSCGNGTLGPGTLNPANGIETTNNTTTPTHLPLSSPNGTTTLTLRPAPNSKFHEAVKPGSISTRGHGVSMSVVRQMKLAIERNREVQVEVVNYRKNGEAFVNLVTIIPVRVPGWGIVDGGGLGTNAGYNLSVGFMCDVTEEGDFRGYHC